MKFRGRMLEQSAIKKFYAVVVSTNKLAKLCVLRLTADKVSKRFHSIYMCSYFTT